MEDVTAELGSLRRTHRASQLRPSVAGSRITVMGWVMATRGHGGISFLTLMDWTGQIQVVAKRGSCSDEIRERISSLKVHSSIAVVGTAKPSERSPGGIEIVPEELYLFSEAVKTPPFEPQARTVRNINTRLEVRPIDLRRDALRHIFLARSRVLSAVREHLYADDFVEISTPKMIATATEGGAALFPIFYYDRQAFLAQSPQLYKEQLTMSFERVFEIAPIFRAESSRTSRHLSEAISVDLEEAFVDYGDVMDRVDALVNTALRSVTEYARENPDAGLLLPEPQDRIPRYTYSEMVTMLQDAGIQIKWGDDLYPQALRKAGPRGFYFVTDWPLGPKPFYVKVSADDSRLSESFDLMFGDLEISSGSTRISRRNELELRMSNKGMKTEAFEYHIGAFDYGMPPHAGCGIGLERLMMALTGVENIRDVTFYPRDVDRLTP